MGKEGGNYSICKYIIQSCKNYHQAQFFLLRLLAFSKDQISENTQKMAKS